MWFWLLIGAIIVGALIGYSNNGSKEDAFAGACMGGMGCLQVLLYLLGTLFSLWLFVKIISWIF